MSGDTGDTNQPAALPSLFVSLRCAAVRCGAHQALQRMTGFGEVSTAQAEYERLADEMWKAQVGVRVVVAGALIPPGCFSRLPRLALLLLLLLL